MEWLKNLQRLLKRRKLVPIPIPERRFGIIPVDPYLDAILAKADHLKLNRGLDSDKEISA